jgi:hypothetical protein
MKQHPRTRESSSSPWRHLAVAALALAAVSVLATPCFADTAVDSAAGEPTTAIVAEDDSQAAAPDAAIAEAVAAPSLGEHGSGATPPSADAPAPSADDPTPPPPESAGVSASELSAQELAKQISNPVTELWQLQFQFNNFTLETEDRSHPLDGEWANNLYFQPVLPISLTEELNLITRPVITLYQRTPLPTPTGDIEHTTDIGDTTLASVLSPAGTEPWIFAAGPTFIFPTAGRDVAGQGKWQAGPAIGGGYITDKFMIAAFAQQWWSFAGDDYRADTSQLSLLPLIYKFFGEGWSVGYSGNVLADWEAPSRDVWTVPLGLSVGKVVKFGILPVQIQLGGQYFVEKADVGPDWNVQLQITPVIPRLIKRTLFGGGSGR